jgi:UDP-glucose 4-epimerase
MSIALVTGGAGFLGSHVAQHLLQTGTEVVILDDLSGGYWRNIPGCEFYVGSIEDRKLIKRLFSRYRFRYVYHLAAYAAEGLSHFIRHFNYRINLLGSVNLINAAVNAGSECFVFTSSAAVYGYGSGTFSERMVPRPMDPYGISKLAVENDLRAASEIWGMPHIIFRPHNVYGERQNLSDPFRNVVGIFMRQVLTGQPCTIFGDGMQTRCFSYVGDLAPIVAGSPMVAAAHNQTFNIGADENCSLNHLAQLVQAALGRSVGIHTLAPRVESSHVACDHDLAHRIFGRGPKTSLAEGLAKMARWAQTVRLGPARSIMRPDILNKLPSAWAHLISSSSAQKSRNSRNAPGCPR